MYVCTPMGKIPPADVSDQPRGVGDDYVDVVGWALIGSFSSFGVLHLFRSVYVLPLRRLES